MGAGLHTGLDSKLYRNTGTHASPVWSEITMVSDVMVGNVKGKAEVKARFSRFVKHLPGMKTNSLEFDLLHDTSIAAHNVLRDAFDNDTVVEFAACDQAIATSGADYWKGEYLIEEFPADQKLENPTTGKVKCALSYLGLNGSPAVDPAWVDVA